MPRPKPVEMLAQCPVWDGLDAGTLVVACSGGRDSVALALAAHELLSDPRFCERFTKPPILVLWHLDHGLRPDSPQDAEFVQRFAEQLGVRCIAERAELAEEIAQYGGNVEAVARMERYTLLKDLVAGTCIDHARPLVAQPARALTAHHLGDQAETVLHHLIRGTRLAGLRGIAPDIDGLIYRPWLDLPHEAIQRFVDERAQAYCMDATNMDERFTRNRLRLQVMPLLQEINPAAQRHIARLAALARKVHAERRLRLSQLPIQEISTSWLYRWLPLLGPYSGDYYVYWLADGWSDTDVLAEFLAEHSGNQPGVVAPQEVSDIEPWATDPRGTLYVSYLRYQLPHPCALVWRLLEAECDAPSPTTLSASATVTAESLQAALTEPFAGELDAWRGRMLQPWERVEQWGTALGTILASPPAHPEWRCYLPEGVALPLSLRTWREGDRIELAGGGTKKLGDIFTDAKIPTCFRPAWAVLVDANDTVLWVPTLADSAAMRISPARPARWLVTIRSTG